MYHSLPDEAIDTLLCFMETSPNKDNSVQFQSLAGAVGEIPPDGTAYFHRDANYIMQYITRWKADKEKETNIHWVESLRRAMLKYVNGTYVNWLMFLSKTGPWHIMVPIIRNLCKLNANTTRKIYSTLSRVYVQTNSDLKI